MPLHPQAGAGVPGGWPRVPPLYTQTLAEARAADLADIQAGGGDPEPVAQVLTDNRGLPGPRRCRCRVRIYRPDRAGEPAAGAGLLLRRRLDPRPASTPATGSAAAWPTLAGCVVSRSATGWRRSTSSRPRSTTATPRCAGSPSTRRELGVDPARIAVGGDSAGGNLAAAVDAAGRATRRPAAGRAAAGLPEHLLRRRRRPSMRENDDPGCSTARSVAWYWQHYLASPTDGRDPLASPLLAPTSAGCRRRW